MKGSREEILYKVVRTYNARASRNDLTLINGTIKLLRMEHRLRDSDATGSGLVQADEAIGVPARVRKTNTDY